MPVQTVSGSVSMQNTGRMITVKKVETSRERRAFLNFPLDLYSGNKCFVPPLYMDERKIFRSDFVYRDCCDFECFIAYKDGKVAGRIQAIIQKAANEKNGEKRARFTRFDVIDDFEVSRALFGAAEQWASERGMDTVCGPLSFSDLEREGLLVEGFDQQATFEENYNAPYYKDHIERLGYEKEVDWLGFRLYGAESPEALEELEQLSKFIFRRYKLHFGPSKSGSDFLKRYADGFFDLIDKSYEGLYGTVPFTPGMRKLVLDNFGLVLSPKYAAVILDENEKPVCFGLAIPSLNRALQGTRGHLTPLTLIRIIRCLRKPDVLDLCLVGVDPEYLNRGVSGALSLAIMRMLSENDSLKWADTNLNWKTIMQSRTSGAASAASLTNVTAVTLRAYDKDSGRLLRRRPQPRSPRKRSPGRPGGQSRPVSDTHRRRDPPAEGTGRESL